jgi:CheY-like chemotaxis protein
MWPPNIDGQLAGQRPGASVSEPTNALVSVNEAANEATEYRIVRQTSPKQSPPPAAQRRKPVILYVEDDEDNWDVAALRLSPHYALVRAATAREACALVRVHGDSLHLILMDIELRGSDFSGTELAQLLRGELPATTTLPAYALDLPNVTRPILFVTAHSAQHELVKLMLSSGEKVIGKPVNFTELMTVLSGLT